MNDLAKIGQPDFSPKTLDEAMQFADMLADSSLVPKDYQGKPGNVLVAIQWGFELGLKPMQALQGIAVINGRPSLWGDAMLALVVSSPVCNEVIESYEGEGEDYAAVCIAKRHGKTDKLGRFSVRDAKTAGLLTKQGPWTQYRDRMLKMRARSWALRDQFSDVLKGMPIAEEAMDNPVDMGAADVVHSSAPGSPRVDTVRTKLAAKLDKRHEALGAPDVEQIVRDINAATTPEELTKAIEPVTHLSDEPGKELVRAAYHTKLERERAHREQQQAEASQEEPELVVTYDMLVTALNQADTREVLDDVADLIRGIKDPKQNADLFKVYSRRIDELERKPK